MRVLLILVWNVLVFTKITAQVTVNQYLICVQKQEQKQVNEILNLAKVPFQIIADDTILVLLLGADSILIQRSNVDIIVLMHEKGYYNAHFDLPTKDTIPMVCNLTLGNKFKWLSLKWDREINSKLIESANISSIKHISGSRYDPREVASIEKKLQNYLENIGYPFAAVWLDSIETDANGEVSGRMSMYKGAFCKIKLIENKGFAKLPKRYLQRLIGCSPGSKYSYEQIGNINRRLSTVPFLQPGSSPAVTFYQNEVNVYLNINTKKANRFDFIIGLLPQTTTNSTTSRLLLTGTLNAAFYNVLNQGEHLLIDIQRLRPETQRLDIKTHLPYLLSLPVGLDGGLNIYKRDSTFLETSIELGIRYNLNRSIYAKLLWRSKSSSLLQVDTASIKTFKRLPLNIDFSQNYYGVETVYESLDFPLNPSTGWYMNGKVAAGTSKIFRNNQIENISDDTTPFFKYSSLYDTLSSQANRINVEINIVRYQPLTRWSTLKLSLKTGALISDKKIFNNEFFRLGGFRTIRGFDEEIFFARKYALATAEYRLLLGRVSYLSLFGDYAILDVFALDNFSLLYPLGLGTGLNLETSAGIFGINVAIGKTNLQPFDGRALKFHLGYVSVF